MIFYWLRKNVLTIGNNFMCVLLNVRLFLRMMANVSGTITVHDAIRYNNRYVWIFLWKQKDKKYVWDPSTSSIPAR